MYDLLVSSIVANLVFGGMLYIIASNILKTFRIGQREFLEKAEDEENFALLHKYGNVGYIDRAVMVAYFCSPITKLFMWLTVVVTYNMAKMWGESLQETIILIGIILASR